jgi:anhydro-N-acetylmuramic acid kinase
LAQRGGVCDSIIQGPLFIVFMTIPRNSWIVAGLMSGTSLDGLDIALCRFELEGDSWRYDILDATTYPYSETWMDHLRNAQHLTGSRLIQLHKEYGAYLGLRLNEFLSAKAITPLLVASHGHTIFHEPDKKLTFQLGDGNSLAATSGLTSITDFRSLDVALGGQGAPLVPIGDELLFGEYDLCLNLGGFANISFRSENKRVAFDVCPVNFVLNRLAASLGEAYDTDGTIAASGQIAEDLLNQLNSVDFYSAVGPKSLGREWVEKHIDSMLTSVPLSLPDKMRTMVEHIARQIGKVINTSAKPGSKVLVTGGGAHNQYLMQRIGRHTQAEIVLPDNLTIDFKEALIFAFLGLLRRLGKINCLCSVTGAARDCCGGVIHSAA